MKLRIGAAAAAAVMAATMLVGMGGTARAATPVQLLEWHNRAYGLCLLADGDAQVTVFACDNTNNGGLSLAEFQWDQYTYSSGSYLFQNLGSGQYLCNWSGSQYVAGCSGGDAWRLVPEPGGYYWFQNAATGFCLAEQSATPKYTSLHPNTCDTADPSSNPGSEWYHTP